LKIRHGEIVEIVEKLCVKFNDDRLRRGKVSVLITTTTRMVQLPATAAIEYVAACCITRTRTITKIVPGCLCPSPPKFNAYTHRLGFLCLAS